MHRKACMAIAVLILALGATPARAQSAPVLDVDAFGIELCQQASPCGAAVFAGLLFGQVGSNPHALGTFIVAVNHEIPLPEPGGTVDLTGGAFELRFGLRRLRGIVSGGDLLANPGNTFEVGADLTLLSGDKLRFEGQLDHTVFPPTVIGRVVSVPQ
jgi:hypothetical protein